MLTEFNVSGRTKAWTVGGGGDLPENQGTEHSSNLHGAVWGGLGSKAWTRGYTPGRAKPRVRKGRQAPPCSA